MAERSVIEIAEIGATETAAKLERVDRSVRQIGRSAVYSGRQTEHGMGLVSRGFGGMAAAFGISSVAIGLKDIAEAGMHLQERQQALRQAVHGNVQEFTALNAAAIKSSEHGGFGRDEQLQSLTQLVATTGSQTEALKANAAAIALARLHGLSYTTAQHYMAQAVVGNVRRLQQYIGVINPVKDAQYALGQAHGVNTIALQEQAKAMGKAGPLWLRQQELYAKITPAMQQAATQQDKLATGRMVLNRLMSDPKYAGEQAAFSKTLQGQVSNLKNSFQEVMGHIGETLIPVFTKIVHAGLTLVDFMAKNKAIAIGLAGAITALGMVAFGKMLVNGIQYAISPLRSITRYLKAYEKGQIFAKAATVETTLAQEAAGAQMTLFDASVGATAAEEVIATGATTGLTVANGALALSIDIVKGAWMMLVAATPLIFLVGISAGIYFIVTHFKQLKAGAVDAFHWVLQAGKDTLSWITGAWHDVEHFLSAPFTSAEHWAVTAFGNIKHAAADALKWIEGAFMHSPLGAMFSAGKGGINIASNLLHGNIGGAADSAVSAGKGILSGLTFGALHTGGKVVEHAAQSLGSHTSKHLYTGGPSGTDTVEGWLSPGEGVLNRQAMAMIGDRGLSLLNSGQLGGGGNGGNQNITITPGRTVVQMADGRVLAEAVTQYVLKKGARGPTSLVGGALATVAA